MISLSDEVSSLIENRVKTLADSDGQYDFSNEIFHATKARKRLLQFLRNLKVAEEFERVVTPNLVSVSLQELKHAFEEGESKRFIELCKKMNGSLEHFHKPEAIRHFLILCLKIINQSLILLFKDSEKFLIPQKLD